jgi:hypothetical protein
MVWMRTLDTSCLIGSSANKLKLYFDDLQGLFDNCCYHMSNIFYTDETGDGTGLTQSNQVLTARTVKGTMP